MASGLVLHRYLTRRNADKRGSRLGLVLVFLLAACTSQALQEHAAPGQEIRVVPITPAVLQAQAVEREAVRKRAETLRAPSAKEDYVYRIGRGDVLLIKQANIGLQPEGFIALTNEQAGLTVDERGEVLYPNIGRIPLAGLTIAEAREMVNERLRAYYHKPDMDVAVLKFNSQWAFVAGAVEKPGAQSLTLQPLYVLEALDQAGGVLQTADYASAYVTTAKGEKKPVDLYALLQQGAVGYNYILRPGDTLHVPENTRNSLFVFGEVEQQGSQPMRYGRKSLSETLADARGVNQVTADKQYIYVVRGALEQWTEATGDAPGDMSAEKMQQNLSQTQVYSLDTRSPAAWLLAENFAMQPRDVVYVSPRPVTEWNRLLSQLLPMFFSPAAAYRLNQI